MNDTEDDKPGAKGFRGAQGLNGSHGLNGAHGPNGVSANGGGDESDTSGRVLHFDPKARERRKPKGRQGAASGKSPFPDDPLRSRVKDAHTGRFRVFRALQIAGVVFALVVFVRSCGV